MKFTPLRDCAGSVNVVNIPHRNAVHLFSAHFGNAFAPGLKTDRLDLRRLGSWRENFGPKESTVATESVIRVFLADDHPLLRAGLRLSFHEEGDIRIIGEAENGFSAVEKIKSNPPDVALIDVDMPGLSGIAAIRVLRRTLPKMKIIVFSTYNDVRYIHEAMQAGADGYVLKSVEVLELKRIIRAFHFGETVESAYLINLSIPEAPAVQTGISTLTHREQQILQHVATGKSNKEIADFFCVSTETVKSHVKNIYKKLNLKNRVEATQLAASLNLLSENSLG
jgi:DNA-binding NarL/FixJ family response regulator